MNSEEQIKNESQMEIMLRGVMISGGLIVTLGAPNAYLLKNGLLRNHIFWISLIFFLCDAMQLTISIVGLGSMISSSTALTMYLSASGAGFLIWYGLSAIYSAFKLARMLDENSVQAIDRSIKTAVLSTFSLALLNPIAYLGTMVVIGGMAVGMPSLHKLEFLTGTLLASFFWFFGLGYGARLLLPLFKSKNAWKLLDFTTGCLMLWLAVELITVVIEDL